MRISDWSSDVCSSDLTGGLIALVYGLVRTTDTGWVSTEALVALGTAFVLLAAFGLLQARRSDPLVPLRLLRNRTVLGADVTGLIFGVAIYALFYFLSIFLATVLGYNPVKRSEEHTSELQSLMRISY